MTLPRIIGLTGYARSGKDTVAGYLESHGYQRVGFADQLKELALRVNPVLHARDAWDDLFRLKDKLRRLDWGDTADGHHLPKGEYDWEYAKQDPEVRRFLQELGNEVRNIVGEDSWIAALARVTKVYGQYQRLAIADVRYRNEAAWIQRMHGEVWRISRFENGVSYENGVDRDHPSERDVPFLSVDLDIINSEGLAELREKVERYLASRVLTVPA